MATFITTTVQKCPCGQLGNVAIDCKQWAENARWNDVGGYSALAEECRQFCRNGHRQ
jgi:hypothetical protein